ncbi:major facilitator superfamily protein (plasmid) [Rhizobium etli bv. mimosae str. Mim1]|nr:major facilitator superfamily protein [Rhizobium etli bv. mimosae str. Mim1]
MSRAADARWRATFAPLKNPTFRSIWLATQVSSLGWFMQTVASSWLMATISPSDLMVALVQASTSLPTFVLSIFAGAIADRFSRRRVMLAGRCLMALASAMLTALVTLGLVDPWIILGLSFLAGCGAALNGPAWEASVGDIVDRPDIPAAVTLTSVASNTVRAIGPALGGIIVASFGLMTAFSLTTFSYLSPMYAVGRRKWKVRSLPFPHESMTSAIYAGLRFAAKSSEIREAVGCGTLFGLASISILALLPLLVRDKFAGGPIAYGILMGGFGTGAVIGGISNSGLRRILPQERLVPLACAACATCSMSLALTPALSLAAPALALGGAGWVIAWSSLGATMQLASPRWIAGRAISIYYAFTYGGIAAGSWVWGALAQKYSLALALTASGGGLLLIGGIGLLLPARNH